MKKLILFLCLLISCFIYGIPKNWSVTCTNNTPTYKDINYVKTNTTYFEIENNFLSSDSLLDLDSYLLINENTRSTINYGQWGKYHGVPPNASKKLLEAYYWYIQDGGTLSWTDWIDNGSPNSPIGGSIVLLIFSIFYFILKYFKNERTSTIS